MSWLETNRWTGPVARFATERHFETLLLAFAAIVFVFFTSKQYIPLGVRLYVPFLLLALVTVPDMGRRAVLLFWINAGLGVTVVINHYVIANHGFMIFYIGLALMFACASGDRASAVAGRAAVLLLSVLMGLALIQKLVSAHYMSGTLIGTYLLNGQMFKVLISLVYPDWPQVVAANVAAGGTLLGAAPGAADSVALTVPAFVGPLALALTWAALLSQATIELFILLRNRFGLWTHWVILGFVLVIYSTRNENIFLSMNLILGYAMTTRDTRAARPWYVLGIAYLLIMEAMGVRPGLLG